VTLYRKRPVVVEARHFDVPPDRLPMALGIELAKWCGGQFMAQLVGLADPRIEIETLEGVMTASLGDWIIKGTAGEFYPIKDSIFRETYEPAEVATDA
jgi:hypothetical protein